jgi:hypothetical protein
VAASTGVFGSLYDFVATPIEKAVDVYSDYLQADVATQAKAAIRKAADGNAELEAQQTALLERDLAGVQTDQAAQLAAQRVDDRVKANTFGFAMLGDLQTVVYVAVAVGVAYGLYKLLK